ncbi:MAG TPA: TrbM/KikA/MpfK family conjugal transfer protein [Arsenophonus nasoniae]|uniref:TrbM/KikA/MpfK family conjugal transfer protein n=1 Tax=Arsenophonus nasoniae TaxID=638 RepID=UPI003878F797
MRKTFLLLIITLFSGYCVAQNVDTDDPCTVFLCMAGKVRGENPSECAAPVKTFVNILKWKKGHIRWSKTIDARKVFLSGCAEADPVEISKIISKFGRMR